MTAGQTPHSESDLREAAATWLVRLQSEQALEADWLAFEDWLADPANRTALAAVESAIGEVETHAEQIAALLRKNRRGEGKAARSAGALVWRWRWRAAGAAMAAAAALFILPQLTPSAPPGRVYTAPLDATRLVAFPDGSSARLNRGASLDVQWKRGERRVTLRHGEAAFLVIHNPSVPFVVEVGATTIRDLGTEFDVLSEQDSLKVSVRAGSVEIKMLGSEAIALRAGSEFRIDAVAHRATVSSANAEDAFAWQDGRLIYHDTPLIEILADLNRYAETPIRLADPEVGKLRFSGALMIQPSAGLVSQLEAFLPLRSEPGKEEILLRGR